MISMFSGLPDEDGFVGKIVLAGMKPSHDTYTEFRRVWGEFFHPVFMFPFTTYPSISLPKRMMRNPRKARTSFLKRQNGWGFVVSRPGDS